MDALIPLRRSACHFLIVCTLHMAALLIVCETQMPATFLATVLVLLASSLTVQVLQIGGRLGGLAMDALAYAEGSLNCYASGRLVFAGTLSPASIVTPYFMLLTVTDDSSKKLRRIFLCRSRFSGDGYRQLTVRLKWS